MGPGIYTWSDTSSLTGDYFNGTQYNGLAKFVDSTSGVWTGVVEKDHPNLFTPELPL